MMEDYSEDIKILKSLIIILERQIKRARDGTMFIIPGSTPQKSIKGWKQSIKKHKALIAFLKIGG